MKKKNLILNINKSNCISIILKHWSLLYKTRTGGDFPVILFLYRADNIVYP